MAVILSVLLLSARACEFYRDTGVLVCGRGFAVFLSQTLLNQSRLSVKSELKPPAGGGEDPTWIDNVFAFDKGESADAEVYYSYSCHYRCACLHKTKYGNWIYAGGDQELYVVVFLSIVSKSAFSWCRLASLSLGVLTVMTPGRPIQRPVTSAAPCDCCCGDRRLCPDRRLWFGHRGCSRCVHLCDCQPQHRFVPFNDNNMFRVMLGLILGAALLNQFLRNRVLRVAIPSNPDNPAQGHLKILWQYYRTERYFIEANKVR